MTLDFGSIIAQQFWCWGRDANRAEGNLLVAYGFRRIPSSRPGAGTSYSLSLPPDRSIGLRAGMSCYAERGVGLVKVCRGDPRVGFGWNDAVPEDWWDGADVLTEHVPWSENAARRARYLTAAWALWVSGYEQWVIDIAGGLYRTCCADAWRHPVVAGPALGTAWSEFACRIAGRPARGH